MPQLSLGDVSRVAAFLRKLQEATDETGVEIGYVGSTVIAVGGNPVGSIGCAITEKLSDDESGTVTYVFDTDQ
jgi:hypothetical protein